MSIRCVLCWTAASVFTVGGASSARQTGGKAVPRDVQALIDRLQSADARGRADAAATLAAKGVRAAPAVPFLIPMLGDHTPLERQNFQVAPTPTSPGAEAFEALAKVGEPAVLPLIAALADQRIAASVAALLGKIRDPRALPPLLRLLESPDLGRDAAKALGTLGDVRALQPLLRLLKSPDLGGAAAEALGTLGDSAAADPLISCLQSPRESVRYGAIKGVGKLRAPAAVAPVALPRDREPGPRE